MRFFKTFLSAGLLMLSTQVLASPVQIKIHGLRQEEGSIFITLFASEESWSSEVPDKTVQFSPLKKGDVVTMIDLQPGTYAFFLFHDEDGNGDLKRNAIGYPAEPYAFSNNVHIGFSKPSFQKMKFAVTAEGALQEINLILP
ncbi:MAG: DUF2141 domain-containing protein [Pseudobdellovibrionaceae bacterium]